MLYRLTSRQAVVEARKHAQRAAHKVAEQRVQLRLQMLPPLLHMRARVLDRRTRDNVLRKRMSLFRVEYCMFCVGQCRQTRTRYVKNYCFISTRDVPAAVHAQQVLVQKQLECRSCSRNPL